MKAFKKTCLSYKKTNLASNIKKIEFSISLKNILNIVFYIKISDTAIFLKSWIKH